MSKVWSIIKFKIKEGCVDEFLEMERKLLSPRNHFLSSRMVIPPFVGLFETRITRPIYTGSVS